MRKRAGFQYFLFVVLIDFPLFFPGLLWTQAQQKPRWWEIKMTISAKGEYKQDAREAQYSGIYVFTIAWTGAMEVDQDDYLLYHTSSELVQWEAQERAAYPQEIKALTTQDFPDKPELKVNYILKKGDGLYLDFFVRGFDVPLNSATEHFYLDLPTSEENTFATSGGSYNPHVKTGSNKIFLDEKQIYRSPLEKSFAWTWKNQGWLQETEKKIFQSNSHSVQAKIIITPH
jgi:hypothetical protein